MVLVSATGFGTNAVLAKLAYRAGLGTEQTLAFRFVLGQRRIAVVVQSVGFW